jgi:hypothetical protein
MNRFQANPRIAEGCAALIALDTKCPSGRRLLWLGPLKDVDEGIFVQADETHVGPETYERLAAACEATGKGMPAHEAERSPGVDPAGRPS